MNLTNEQNKVLLLTMELDLKANEYKDLCNQFEKIKTKLGSSNLEKLTNLKLSQ